jgi:hypothetical protein
MRRDRMQRALAVRWAREWTVGPEALEPRRTSGSPADNRTQPRFGATDLRTRTTVRTGKASSPPNLFLLERCR